MFAIYFEREEFACQCGCGQDTVDAELMRVMDDVRAYFNRPVTISSGNRCVSHNKIVGGSGNSQHLYSKAADFVVIGVHEDIVADYLEKKYSDTYGIGRYNGRTHVDCRENKARWDKR